MLRFFSRYQRYFFFIVTVIIIASFTFFGVYDAVGMSSNREDRVVSKAIDGSSVMASELRQLSRFIASDCDDVFQSRGLPPNFCNDGVIRKDFLQSRLAELLVREYYPALKGGFESRLAQAKRFKPYVHPASEYLSAQNIWDHFLPSLSSDMKVLQGEEMASFKTFQHLSRLYLAQSQLPPEMLRRILIHQHKQFASLPVDQKLNYEDLSLFGFHTTADWFGKDFIDLVSQFILNGAAFAEEKGYKVSLEEAKGDLLHHFDTSMKKMISAKMKPDISFFDHLRSMGLDEQSAASLWRKVLLFRRYFDDIGESVYVDRLPYQDFSNFANETATVEKYEWPIELSNGEDLAAFQYYVKAVSAKTAHGLPASFLSVEAVEKGCPDLVQSKYKGQVAEVTKRQLALRPTMMQLWQWQKEDANWALLQKKFSLEAGVKKEERFALLEKYPPHLRAEIDLFSRETMVDQNPSWVQEALLSAPLNEKSWVVSGNKDPISSLSTDGKFFRVENLEKIEDKHVLTFAEGKRFLYALVKSDEGKFSQDKNPLFKLTKEALLAVAKNPTDKMWVQADADPLKNQFKLRKTEQAVSRTSQENWMKEQAFIVLPEHWSPVHVADDGKIVFFYMKERKIGPAPILDQINFGKATLSSDAKGYAAEKLVKKIKSKKAIVLPIVNEESNESI